MFEKLTNFMNQLKTGFSFFSESVVNYMLSHAFVKMKIFFKNGIKTKIFF